MDLLSFEQVAPRAISMVHAHGNRTTPVVMIDHYANCTREQISRSRVTHTVNCHLRVQRLYAFAGSEICDANCSLAALVVRA